MSISTNYVKKTGFLSGLTTIPQINTANTIHSIPRTRGDDEIIGLRPSFAKAPKKERFIRDFARLKQLEIDRKGLLVRFGPDILSKLLTVEMPDENNPNVNIRKEIPLGQLLLSQDGRLAGINTVLNNIASKGGDLNVADSLENLNVLSALVVKSLNDVIEKNEAISEDRMMQIIKANNYIFVPQDPRAANVPLFVTKNDLSSGKSGYLLSFLLHSKNIRDPQLSITHPVYGLNQKPVTVDSMISSIRRGQTLDVANRQLFKPGSGYMSSPLRRSRELPEQQIGQEEPEEELGAPISGYSQEFGFEENDPNFISLSGNFPARQSIRGSTELKTEEEEEEDIEDIE